MTLEHAPGKLLKPHDVIVWLNISRSTFYRWVEEGRIRAKKVNGLLRIHPDELQRVQRDYFED